jgi:hypothetical protein
MQAVWRWRGDTRAGFRPFVAAMACDAITEDAVSASGAEGRISARHRSAIRGGSGCGLVAEFFGCPSQPTDDLGLPGVAGLAVPAREAAGA